VQAANLHVRDVIPGRAQRYTLLEVEKFVAPEAHIVTIKFKPDEPVEAFTHSLNSLMTLQHSSYCPKARNAFGVEQQASGTLPMGTCTVSPTLRIHGFEHRAD